ncbi:unnamed protein product [Urochloa humidicola]
MLSRRGRRKGKKKLRGGGRGDQKQKALHWRLPEIASNYLGKIGLAIGCGGIGGISVKVSPTPSRRPARRRLPRLLACVRCPREARICRGGSRQFQSKTMD